LNGGWSDWVRIHIDLSGPVAAEHSLDGIVEEPRVLRRNGLQPANLARFGFQQRGHEVVEGFRHVEVGHERRPCLAKR
jgi:hypothetical protein